MAYPGPPPPPSLKKKKIGIPGPPRTPREAFYWYPRYIMGKRMPAWVEVPKEQATMKRFEQDGYVIDLTTGEILKEPEVTIYSRPSIPQLQKVAQEEVQKELSKGLTFQITSPYWLSRKTVEDALMEVGQLFYCIPEIKEQTIFFPASPEYQVELIEALQQTLGALECTLQVEDPSTKTFIQSIELHQRLIQRVFQNEALLPKLVSDAVCTPNGKVTYPTIDFLYSAGLKNPKTFKPAKPKKTISVTVQLYGYKPKVVNVPKICHVEDATRKAKLYEENQIYWINGRKHDWDTEVKEGDFIVVDHVGSLLRLEYDKNHPNEQGWSMRNTIHLC